MARTTRAKITGGKANRRDSSIRIQMNVELG